MTSRSKPLDLDQVIPGMVLSDNLLDAHGNILLAEGVTLSESTINGLRRHGVDTVPVLCEAPLQEDEAAEHERHRVRIAKLFRKQGENEAAALMRSYITRYRLGDQS